MGNITAIAQVPEQLQTLYTDKLLAHVIQLLVLDQFAVQEPFPMNMNADTIRFFKKRAAKVGDVVQATEGVSPTTSQYTTIAPLTYVEAQLKEYFEITAITKKLTWTMKIKMLKETIQSMGEDCALHCDAVIRNEIIARNIADAVAGTKRYAGTATNFATLQALDQTNGILNVQDMLDVFTSLKILRCPKKMGGTKTGGSYVFIMPPQVSRDLMNDSKWEYASAYAKPDQLFKGEAGEIRGLKVIEQTNPFIEDGSDAEGVDHGPTQLGTSNALPPSANAIFSSFATGQGAYGVPIMAGKSPFSPKISILDQADKSDPFNQRTYAGWITYWAAILYQSNWLVVYRSKSGHGVGA
jgi:N4-gp56 family major capsid protein